MQVDSKRPARVLLHVDMDAFFAAIEVRENPDLAGKPVIVGHRGRRGVVSTCSYEARRYGVHSAMPSVTAQRLCPSAVWVNVNMSLYSSVSRRIRAIFESYSPRVEPLSVDEAFIDLSGIAAALEDGVATARELKRRVVEDQSLGCSVGIAPNKFLAKVASDLDKPDGLVLLSHEQVPSLLWPLPVGRLWGVGPETAAKLKRGGITTIGMLTRVETGDLSGLVGPRSAAHLQALARGEDDREVQPTRLRKSISEERTYREDLTDPEQIDRALLARAEGVARDLRRKGWKGHTVHLKLRTGDFKTWTRSLTLRAGTDLAEPIVSAARAMLRERIRTRGRGVRLIGVGVSGLEPAKTGQGDLFPDAEEVRARRVARAADEIRSRMGEESLTRARLLRKPGPD